MFSDKALYCVEVGTRGNWYIYENHVWKIDEGCLIFKDYIQNEYIPKLNAYRKKIREEIISIEEAIANFISDFTKKKSGNEHVNKKKSELDQRRTYLLKKEKICIKISDKVESDRSFNSIIHYGQTIFNNRDFAANKDKNINLFCFQNGVIDLNLKRFRPGMPEDYCTLQSKIEFHVVIDAQDKLITKTFLHQILPDKAYRTYFKKIISLSMRGKNIRKQLPMLVGPPNASKSTIVCVLERIFGTYMSKLNSNNVSKRGVQSATSGTANADITQLDNLRLVIVDELNADQQLDIGFLKKITGKDSVLARTPYAKKSQLIENMPVVCFQANCVPHFPDADEAFWTRVDIIPFESKFSIDAPKTEEMQKKARHFPIIPDIDEKYFPIIAPTLASMLYKSFVKYDVVSGIAKPDVIIHKINSYRLKNNAVENFFRERIHKINHDDPSFELCYLKYTDVKENFLKWFRVEYPGYKVDNTNFQIKIEALMDTYFDEARKIWRGYTMEIVGQQ
jgi:hypothetical protein